MWRGASRVLAGAALLLAAIAISGCVSVPDAVEAEFTAPDGRRPNNYHACEPCAKAAKERRGAQLGMVPCPALVSH